MNNKPGPCADAVLRPLSFILCTASCVLNPSTLILAVALMTTAAPAAPKQAIESRIERTEKWIASANNLRNMLWNDPHRPTYHFMPREAWMNDINGCIFWKGRYHIFYQYNDTGAYWHLIQWGHASSVDLVHWVHHPAVMKTDPNGPDREGVYSGGAFLTKEGVPAFIYHGRPDGTCIATADDDMLLSWTKHPANPVIKVPKEGDPGYGKYIVYDPCAWLYKGKYYALIGNYAAGRKGREGDTTYLFTSDDLVDWQFICRFYKADLDIKEPREDCAVPDFFPIGDKWMLLFTSHLQGTQYYIGTWEGREFTPERHAWMHWPGGHLGGPRSMLDGRGRRLFFDWVTEEARPRERQRASGWSGVTTLPRVLTLRNDGTLGIEPVPEIEVLRYNHRSYEDISLEDGCAKNFSGVKGNTMELAVEIDPGTAAEVGVKVLCSPDGSEQTPVVYDHTAGVLKVVVGKSSLDEAIKYMYYRNSSATNELPEDKRYVTAQEAPFRLAEDETLKLRIFLDRSIMEVFANGRQCITQRVFPTRPDSTGVSLYSRGGKAKVKTLDAWKMAPANSY